MASVAVYAICRDEAKHAARFMASMGEADGIFVLDTGSCDGSPRILRDLGAVVEEAVITPWRFDTARNRALAMVPADFDICICCDLDEVFAPGWRQVLEAVWTADTTRLAYPFYYAPDGSFFYRSLIHRRRGYIWVWPIHEALMPLIPEQMTRCDTIRLYHRPDPEKSRAQYLPMLEQAVMQHPKDTRMLRYLGREYYRCGQFEKAIDALSRHTSLETWDAECAASYRELARCRWMLHDLLGAEADYRRSIKACPTMREGYIELAQLLVPQQRNTEAAALLDRARAIRSPHPTYFNEGWAWDGTAERLRAHLQA